MVQIAVADFNNPMGLEKVGETSYRESANSGTAQLGTLPLMLAADQTLLKTYLPAVASGEAMFSYALSEREAGSDAASMKCRAVEGDGGWVLNGQKSWITNAGVSRYYTVMALTDPDKRTRGGITAFVVEDGDEGFSYGALEKKLGIKGSPTRELYFDDVRIPIDNNCAENALRVVALGDDRLH